jgi:universal stress protein A
MLVNTILHPTDLSEESATAFQFADTLARDYGARLVLLSVVPPPLTGAEAVDYRRPDSIRQDVLAKLRELKPAPGVEVEYRVGEGDAADVILTVAGEVRADLIVMGTHGRSGLRRALMGSVAEAVTRGARCPVATVRSSVPIPAGTSA